MYDTTYSWNLRYASPSPGTTTNTPTLLPLSFHTPTGPFPVLESQLLLAPQTPVDTATAPPSAFIASGNANCASQLPAANTAG